MIIDRNLQPEGLRVSIDRLFSLSAEKIVSIEKSWAPGSGAPVFTAGGKYTSRGWTESEWQESADRLMEQDLVETADDGGVQGSGLQLTESGRTLRQELEETTQLAALDGWAHLGLEGTRRLAELLNPLRRSVIASGVLTASRS